MSDLHKSDPDSPYADDLEFVRDYARRNDGYQLVQPVVDFINAHLTPQIIRTVEELEALDPDTLLIISPDGEETITVTAGDIRDVIAALSAEGETPPAVVVAPADQVRAAHKALKEA